MEIKGYTLHGDYYLSDKVIPNKNWEEACEMKEEITLPNGKKVIAHTLSKKELETISQKERTIYAWYWTNTPDGDFLSCYVGYIVGYIGDFGHDYFYVSNNGGGARLGFKNPF